ncbi:hypothetical protein [Mucilaginibacter ginkgonis]|uniref:Uncharacterized protein n=1 Tax=Mucilaginibacter ginkgonis TaxID=2682091 RepID=A0A6I4I505_9SPHI|nr:hypothetical protein [Mucilaginibacter ginkgonis]QQL48336.1 hypothetical protein GO620_009020 [Mucilaginibacter ginkgonis]
MKILYAFTIALLLTTTANAQKYIPQIKQGSVLSYQAHANALGQSLPFTLTILNADSTLTMQWLLAGYGTGKFVIAASAIQSANKIGFKQPEPDEITKLKDNETLVTVSKTVFKDLTEKKSFTLNGRNFTVTQDNTDFKINDKVADVFYAVDDKGKTKLWILNTRLSH